MQQLVVTPTNSMADVAQLVRAPACDAGGWGFKSPHSPHCPTFNLKSGEKFFRELFLS